WMLRRRLFRSRRRRCTRLVCTIWFRSFSKMLARIRCPPTLFPTTTSWLLVD
ncbi:hypothetical protein IW137_003547, partial [Coemansia sp. RSA 1287]